MTRLELFQKALERCNQLSEQYPLWEVLDSIRRQLEYLVGVESGAITDYAMLNGIVLGVQATKEIDPEDSGFADLLRAAFNESLELAKEYSDSA